jgi:hypothetical protein
LGVSYNAVSRERKRLAENMRVDPKLKKNFITISGRVRKGGRVKGDVGAESSEKGGITEKDV